MMGEGELSSSLCHLSLESFSGEEHARTDRAATSPRGHSES